MNQNQKRLEILEAEAQKLSSDSWAIVLASGETEAQARQRLFGKGYEGTVAFIPECLSGV